MTQTEALIFYFDLVGVVAQFVEDQAGTLGRVRAFQDAARARFDIESAHTALTTFGDNVWARVELSAPDAIFRTLSLAASVMRDAKAHGFPVYFGAITRGWVEVKDETRSKAPHTAHIDMTSVPHIRAVLAEKWAGALWSRRASPAPEASVWVGTEVCDEVSLQEVLTLRSVNFKIVPEIFDLKHTDAGRPWPLQASRFQAIMP